MEAPWFTGNDDGRVEEPAIGPLRAARAESEFGGRPWVLAEAPEGPGRFHVASAKRKQKQTCQQVRAFLVFSLGQVSAGHEFSPNWNEFFFFFCETNPGNPELIGRGQQ